MTASARLLIVGPQGSGKGTQGVRIAESYGIPVVSTGDIFRANIKEGRPSASRSRRSSTRVTSSRMS